jgi:hypothetical protein
MATNPLVYGPDGVLRQTVIYSTTVETKFLRGTLPDDAVDAQVSINGSGWSSDTGQLDWGDGAWTVPNSVSEPNGLVLLPGNNIVKVRAILPSGSTTPETTATVRLVSSSDVGVVGAVPTNISVAQEDTAVVVRAETSSTTGFQGMNYYASAYQGGGASGYTRINVETINEGTTVQEETNFATLDAVPDIKVDAEGDPVADPMVYRIIGRQEDEDEVVLQTDINQTYTIPETARDLRVVVTIATVRNATLYTFSHNRSATSSSTPSTVQVGSFAALPSETPLFYVVAAVYYDTTQNLEFESSFSEEVSGHPTAVTTALAAFPTVSRQSIVQQFITAVFRSNPQVKVEAGSILRDTIIDPYSSEAERLRFVLDFFHRARTPTLLLQIDDPNGSGTSIPVAQSPYKQGLQSALYLTSASDVQALIDSAFEAYASNYGKRRLAGTAAVGEVTFFTTRRPTATILMPLGTTVAGGGVQFATTRVASIDFATLASFYDPVTGRYQVTVPVRALTVGTAGNLGVGQVSSVVSSLTGSVSVVNQAAMVPGDNLESNLALTVRVRNALASVDSGTARGYLQTAADVPGVVKANVVSAGDALMQRDLDTAGEHKGGKVDIWVQGTNLATVTDVFAFAFQIGHNIQFEIVGTPSDYIFRALDTSLSSSSPIVEMLDDEAAGYELRNASSGDVFDLTGVTILTYDTIQLSTTVTQPSVDLSDVVLGSYRRRAGSDFVLPRQPATAISSVSGTVSGTLAATATLLVHPDAPLGIGRSTLSQDYLQITSYTADDGSAVPSGDAITVTDESHVLTGQYAEFLDNLGANYLTVVVKDSTGLITYKGPDDSSGDPDYTVNLGTQTTALSVVRTETGDIASGATVLISYEHDENFTVTYTTNLIVSLTQDAVNLNKHATADVVAKDALPIALDVEATVVLIRGRESSTVDTALRTNLANFFANLRLGDPVRQSDIVHVIEGTTGVSYVVVPLSKMVPALGSTIVREDISTDVASESSLVTDLSTNDASVYLLNNGLLYATTDGGGAVGSFRAVFQDDVSMSLQAATASLTALGVAPGRAYIIGSDGRSIVGISDDATLTAAGYVTSTAIVARRKELTANHILVSLTVGAAPTSYEYSATYVIGSDTTAKNVDPGAAQYVTGGSFLFTYDEDR